MKLLMIFVLLSISSFVYSKPICYIVSSYANGYQWEDSVQESLRLNLDDHCIIIHFELDSKNRFGRVKEKAKQAFDMMVSIKPKLVITTDNNAYEYFVENYRVKIKVPVFALGLNWVAPNNTLDTFVVEVPPIEAILERYSKIKTAKLLLGESETSNINLVYYRDVFKRHGIDLKYCISDNIDQWKDSFILAQKYDLVLLQNNAGIRGWEPFDVKRFVKKHTNTSTVSVNSWMLPYVQRVFNKLPSEQAYLLSERVIQYLKTGVVENSVSYNVMYEELVNKGLK